ncbi:MAG: type VI secretion system amidase effector protein Tae4 [Pseudomonadota bacterium]
MDRKDLNFDALWKAYPFSERADQGTENPGGTVEEINKLVGGHVELNDFENMCAVRMSRALNYAGWPVPPHYKHKVMKTFSVGGADKKWYMFRVRELRNYLIRELGKPDVARPSKKWSTDVRIDFLKRRGIIIFDVPDWKNATGHVTLWKDDKPADREYFEKATKVELWRIDSKSTPITINPDGTRTASSTAF